MHTMSSSGNRRNMVVSVAFFMLVVNTIGMLSELSVLLPAGAGASSKTPTLLELLKPPHKKRRNDPLFSLCTHNPYISALSSSLMDISGRMDEWLQSMDRHRAMAAKREMSRHDHARFFPFQVLEPCQQKTCVGGKCYQDASKIVCGLGRLLHPSTTTTVSDIDNPNCVIYSIGGNNWWQFENDLLEKTSCEIHTFDCTGSLGRFHKPNHERLHFHHVCLGTRHEEGKTQQECEKEGDISIKCGETWTLREIQDKLQHKQIDLLKMDVEGFEWPLLESWPELGQEQPNGIVLPMQILVEIHYQTQFEELRPLNMDVNGDFKTSFDMVELQGHLLRMGYVVVERDDNKFCRHCTELTLIRSLCNTR